MKNAIFATSMTVFAMVGLSACSKCEICTKDSSPELRICEKDYGSNTEYGLTLDYHENNGYTCR